MLAVSIECAERRSTGNAREEAGAKSLEVHVRRSRSSKRDSSIITSKAVLTVTRRSGDQSRLGL